MQTSKNTAAIIPLLIGNEAKALEVAADLLEKNIFIPAVRYPTVARGQARLRLTLSAAHSPEQIEHAASVLQPWLATCEEAIPH